MSKPVHILDVLGKVPDTWVVVGKGPSYDYGKVCLNDHPVCCLNETCNQIPCELTLMNDRTVLSKIDRAEISGCDLFGIAIGPHHFAHPREVQVDFFAQCAETLTRMGDKLTYFDLRTCAHQEFPNHPKIQAHYSVYETALWILGYAGAKRILTTAIDGGCDYHPDFGERDLKYKHTDLTPQFERAQIPIREFGLTVEKL